MLTIRELYNFLHEKGVADSDIDLLFSVHENFDGDFCRNKDNILKTFGDEEVYGIDIYRKDLIVRDVW